MATLHFNGTDRLHNHLYQKFLDTTPQDAYHIVYSDGYEGSTSQAINGVNVKMRLNRTNTDRGFYSLTNDVEVFSIDHGVYDDTVKLTNDGGEVFMLNFAKTYTVDNTLDHAQVMSKFVADCNEVPEGTPFKPEKK